MSVALVLLSQPLKQVRLSQASDDAGAQSELEGHLAFQPFHLLPKAVCPAYSPPSR